MRRNSGFTLIELLITIAIIAVLVAMLLPAILKVRSAANRTGCASKLRELGLACHSYHDANQVFPPGYTASSTATPMGTDPGWGWAAYILPYLEQSGVYYEIDFCRPVESSVNSSARLMLMRGFRCPADSGPWNTFTISTASGRAITQAGPTSYAASCGAAELDDIPGPLEGVFYRNSTISIAAILDGTSTTCLIGDRCSSWSMCPWAGAVQGGVVLGGPRNPMRNQPDSTEPAPYMCLAQTREINDAHDRDGALDDFNSEHAGGINMLFADGGVRFLKSGTSPTVFAALGTRAGGEIVSDTDFQ